MENIEKVLEKLRTARNERGYSHEAVAYDLGISQAAYSNLENNHTKLTVERLLTLAKLLDKPIYYFFESFPNNVYNQNFSDNSYGHIENLHQENKDAHADLVKSYEEMVRHLKEEIEFLRGMVKK